MNPLRSALALPFRSRGKCAPLLLAALLSSLALAAPAARADTFTVTSTGDGGNGSLREGMVRANSELSPNDDAIVFASSLNGLTITLSSEIVYEITSGGSGNVTIDASNLPDGITIKGAGTSRLFHFKENTVTLRNLKLTRGGGGGSSDPGLGGAIYAKQGTLILEYCTFSANSASFDGGAIYASSVLKMTGCTVSGNTTPRLGGAIYCSNTTRLVNCTIAGNQAPKGSGIFFSGNLRNCELVHCTVAGNLAGGDGAGIETAGNGTLRLVNTIVAGNTAGLGSRNLRDLKLAAGTTFRLDGQNIIQTDPGNTAGIGLLTIGHVIFADPKLLPLGSYGGPTQTMPPIPGKSQAIEAGRSAAFEPGDEPPTRDQRGFPRVSGQWGDIGAVEFGFSEFDFTTGKHTPGNILVDTATDELDPIGTDGAGISLREAIRDVKTDGSVFFSPTVFPEGSAPAIQMNPSLGTIVLKRNVTIDARANMRPGSNSYVSLTQVLGPTARTFRIIEIPALPSAVGLTVVTLRGLTVELGGAPDSRGGAGILNAGGDLVLVGCRIVGCYSDYEGGGVANYQVLTMDRCLIDQCRANRVGGTVGGGAVSNHGILYAQQCVLKDNRAGLGAGIDHETVAGTAGTNADPRQNMQLVHCTVVNNMASGTGGGGIYAPVPWTLWESVVSSNQASVTPGPGIASDVVTIDTSSVIAGKTVGSLLLGGSSIVQNGLLNLAGQPFTRSGVIEADPLLGGDTRPEAGSPAIDKGTNKNPYNETILSDLFGHAFVSKPDLGAVESGSLTQDGKWEAALAPTSNNPGLEAELTATATSTGLVTGSLTLIVPTPAPAPGARSAFAAVQVGGKTLVIKFKKQLGSDGNATLDVVVGGKTLTLTLNINDGVLNATLTDPDSGDSSTAEFTASLKGKEKSVLPPTIVGRYSVVMGELATGVPLAFGTLTVKASRSVAFVGQIADGTKVSFGSRLNRNFHFRGRASLYGGKGFLRMRAALDPEGFTTAGFNYILLPSNRGAVLRPGGYKDKAPAAFASGFFSPGQDVALHRYVPPAKGRQATESFQEAAGALVYGTLRQIIGGPNPESNFVLAVSGKATSAEVGFKFKLDPKTGLFSGSQPSNVVGAKPIPFSGVILQTFDATALGVGASGFGAGLGVKLDPDGDLINNAIYVGKKP